MPKATHRIVLPVEIEFTHEGEGRWTATLQRKVGGPPLPITTLKGLSAAEVFTKFNYKLPEPVIFAEGLEQAREVIADGLNSVSGRDLIKASEVQDILLDALNRLGKEGATVDSEAENQQEGAIV